LNRALKQKCPIITQRKRKVILLHDNARPHIAKVIKDIDTWKVLSHASYLLDCAPHYHLFRSMWFGFID